MAIVFEDLQKLAVHSQQDNKRKKLFQRLQGKPFWIWDKEEHFLRTLSKDIVNLFADLISVRESVS